LTEKLLNIYKEQPYARALLSIFLVLIKYLRNIRKFKTEISNALFENIQGNVLEVPHVAEL
jgi:hypothetical protein